MRITILALALGLGACWASAPISPAAPAPTQAAPAPTATPGEITWIHVWAGDVRKVGGHWTLPTVHAGREGAKLMVDVAVSVDSEGDLVTADVAIEIYAGKRRLACRTPDPLSFTRTGSITAQASVQCENPKREIPSRVVVAVRGSRETFEMQLASLTTPN